MTDKKTRIVGSGGAARPLSGPKRRYETPRLTDYGHVTKLTLTGGITTRDTGNMSRPCL